MDLNDLEPYYCQSCRSERSSLKIDLTNTLYYKPNEVPSACPVCGHDSIVKLERICLVKADNEVGVFRASEKAREQNHGRVKRWSYWCERSCDEHSKTNIPKHTVVPEASNCPACIAAYNSALELAGNLFRVKE